MTTTDINDDPSSLVCSEDAVEGSGSLAFTTRAIIKTLAEGSRTTIADVDPSLHYLPPYVPKPIWTTLGNLVTAHEKVSEETIHGSRWISLRLDGSGFSKTVKRMRRLRILDSSPGFSHDFADAMKFCLRKLMENTNAKVRLSFLLKLCE